MNIWTSGIAIVTAAAWLVFHGRARPGVDHETDWVEAKSPVDDAS